MIELEISSEVTAEVDRCGSLGEGMLLAKHCARLEKLCVAANILLLDEGLRTCQCGSDQWHIFLFSENPVHMAIAFNNKQRIVLLQFTYVKLPKKILDVNDPKIIELVDQAESRLTGYLSQ